MLRIHRILVGKKMHLIVGEAQQMKGEEDTAEIKKRKKESSRIKRGKKGRGKHTITQTYFFLSPGLNTVCK